MLNKYFLILSILFLLSSGLIKPFEDKSEREISLKAKLIYIDTIPGVFGVSGDFEIFRYCNLLFRKIDNKNICNAFIAKLYYSTFDVSKLEEGKIYNLTIHEFYNVNSINELKEYFDDTKFEKTPFVNIKRENVCWSNLDNYKYYVSIIDSIEEIKE